MCTLWLETFAAGECVLEKKSQKIKISHISLIHHKVDDELSTCSRTASRLEGGNLTEQAASYPPALVRDILRVIGKVKQTYRNATYPKDPAHMTTPESLRESEHAMQIAYNQNTWMAHDSNPPKGVDWQSVVSTDHQQKDRDCYVRTL